MIVYHISIFFGVKMCLKKLAKRGFFCPSSPQDQAYDSSVSDSEFYEDAVTGTDFPGIFLVLHWLLEAKPQHLPVLTGALLKGIQHGSNDQSGNCKHMNSS